MEASKRGAEASTLGDHGARGILETVMIGLVSGLASATVMYALLLPVARGKPLPPDVFAATIVGRDPHPRSLLGVFLQLAFGAFWGVTAAILDDWSGPIAGSHVAHGLLAGVAAFVVSVTGFLFLRLIPRPVDWREWVGHFLSHLVFGATLGFALLSFQGI